MSVFLKKLINWIRVFLLLFLVAVIAASLPKLRALGVQDILTYTPDVPFLAFLALTGFYCFKSVTIFLPLTLLYISAGVMFPLWIAIPVTYFGLACEMTIGYFLGGRLGREGVEKLVTKNAKLGKLLAPSEKTFNAVCFIVRLVPGPLPLDIMSMLFGATRISYTRYLLFSLLGVSPGMLAWVISGTAVSNPLSKEFLIPFSIALVITVAAFILLQILGKKTLFTEKETE